MFEIRSRGRLWFSQIPHDLSLTLIRNFSVVKEGRQSLLVPEVLTPCLELFRGLANLLTKLDKRVSKAVRIEIRKASPGESLAKYLPNRRGGAPMISS